MHKDSAAVGGFSKKMAAHLLVELCSVCATHNALVDPTTKDRRAAATQRAESEVKVIYRR